MIPATGGFAAARYQDRDEHGAGHVLAGAEDVGVLRADAVDKAVAVHEVDGVGRPLERAGDIGELARRRLLHDLEGQRALVAAVDGVADLDGLAVGQREDIEVVDGVGAGEGESRRAEILGCERGAAVDLAVLRVELAAGDTVMVMYALDAPDSGASSSAIAMDLKVAPVEYTECVSLT